MTQEVNVTSVIEFVLLGFSNIPGLQNFLSIIFFFSYAVILFGNGIIILISKVDRVLQTPMYFFLRKFSFLEIFCVSATLLRMLIDLWTWKGKISLFACAAQMYFSLVLGGTESLLLTGMAYEGYVAICDPLHYPLIMNHKFCAKLVAASWLTGMPVHVGQTFLIFSLPFCGSNQINHFFCCIPPLLKLACGETFQNEILIFTIIAAVFITVPFSVHTCSYSKIISTILKSSSTTGRVKAFSTCSSHVIVVALFFGSAIITFFRPI